MAKTLIGIDLNAIEVSFAHSNGEVAYEKMPANLIDSSTIVSPETLADFLKKVKKKIKLSGSDCAIVLPESATFFRTVESPIISEEQLKLNLPFEFRDFVGVNSINYNYDYMVEEIVKDESGKAVSMKLLAAAALKDVVEEYARILKKAGFRLKVALPNEVCVINLMKKVANPNKEYCLIGVDYDFTRVYIFKGSTLRASKVIEIGNHEIDAVIARNENTEEYLAASVRDNNHNNILASSYLTSTYERIALEIMKTINFYKYEHNDSILDSVHFFAMGCNNATLCDTICSYIDFKKGNIKELLPSPFDDERVLMNIGLIL